MNTRFLVPAALLAAFGLAVPAIAFADDGAQDARRGERRAPHGDHAKGEKPSFPIAGETFVDHVEKRIERKQAHLEKALERRKVEDSKKQEIMADFQAGAQRIMSAAENVASDGTVTKEEARSVRAVAKQVRDSAASKWGKPGKKGKKADGKKGKRSTQGVPAASGSFDNAPTAAPADRLRPARRGPNAR